MNLQRQEHDGVSQGRGEGKGIKASVRRIIDLLAH
jgi:hypothetical protein